MFKRYLNIFFPQTKKKRNKKWFHFLFSWKIKKKTKRKYQKRKKSLIQKLINQINVISTIPGWIQYISVSIAILCLWTYLLFYSEYTTIKTINIYREWALIDINRSYSIVDYLRGNNLLSADSSTIAQRLQRSQSSISEIRINKDFPDTINIYLNSYTPVFQTENHFILSNGSIIVKEEDVFPDIQKIYLSEDISQYDDFQQKIAPETLESIANILSESNKNILAFTPNQIFYFLKEREIIIRDDVWTLYIFDLEKSAENQIKQLAIYEKESAPDSRWLLSYIDLRIPDKLFLCNRDLQSVCLNNINQIYGNIILQNPLPEVSESQQ